MSPSLERSLPSKRSSSKRSSSLEKSSPLERLEGSSLDGRTGLFYNISLVIIFEQCAVYLIYYIPLPVHHLLRYFLQFQNLFNVKNQLSQQRKIMRSYKSNNKIPDRSLIRLSLLQRTKISLASSCTILIWSIILLVLFVAFSLRDIRSQNSLISEEWDSF